MKYIFVFVAQMGRADVIRLRDISGRRFKSYQRQLLLF